MAAVVVSILTRPAWLWRSIGIESLMPLCCILFLLLTQAHHSVNSRISGSPNDNPNAFSRQMFIPRFPSYFHTSTTMASTSFMFTRPTVRPTPRLPEVRLGKQIKSLDDAMAIPTIVDTSCQILTCLVRCHLRDIIHPYIGNSL